MSNIYLVLQHHPSKLCKTSPSRKPLIYGAPVEITGILSPKKYEKNNKPFNNQENLLYPPTANAELEPRNE